MRPIPQLLPKLGGFPLLLALVCLDTGCGTPSPIQFRSLLLDQPYVLEISPPDRSALPDPVEISLVFSERVDLANLTDQTVSLLAGLPDEEILNDGAELIEKLAAGELPTVPLQYVLEADERSLNLFPETPLSSGVYLLVVTPQLRSVNGVPFNQKPGERPTPFLARYTLGDIPQTSLDPGGETGPGHPGGPVFGPAPEHLVISEFLYDGKVSDTDGENFIELFGTPGADLSLFQILLINGGDGAETERITLPPGSILPEDGIFLIADLRTGSTTASQVAAADFLDQFDPQNGPDGIQLLDRDGNLWDTVAYDEGAPVLAGNGLALGEGNPAADVAGGHSLSRVSGQDSQDNTADFIDLATPTPGVL